MKIKNLLLSFIGLGITEQEENSLKEIAQSPYLTDIIISDNGHISVPVSAASRKTKKHIENLEACMRIVKEKNP